MKKLTISSKKKKIVYNINMPNKQENNEIEHINEEINLLQDLHKKNEKNQNQFPNGLIQIRRIRVKKGQDKSFSNQKNIMKNIFQNK